MGSIVMHLCVASEVSKELNILQINKFFIGSIAPDVYKLRNDGNGRGSHYLVEVIEGERKYSLPDLNAFINEYGDKIKKDIFILGYYVHLIADKIWYKEVSGKYVKKIPESDNLIIIKTGNIIEAKEYRKLMYMDYNLINQFLIKLFKLNVDYLKEIVINEEQNLQVLLSTNVEEILDDIQLEELENRLNIITINDVLEWIEKSKKEAIKAINELSNN